MCFRTAMSRVVAIDILVVVRCLIDWFHVRFWLAWFHFIDWLGLVVWILIWLPKNLWLIDRLTLVTFQLIDRSTDWLIDSKLLVIVLIYSLWMGVFWLGKRFLVLILQCCNCAFFFGCRHQCPTWNNPIAITTIRDRKMAVLPDIRSPERHRGTTEILIRACRAALLSNSTTNNSRMDRIPARVRRRSSSSSSLMPRIRCRPSKCRPIWRRCRPPVCRHSPIRCLRDTGRPTWEFCRHIASWFRREHSTARSVGVQRLWECHSNR